MGLKTTPILHINTTNNEKISKCVEIQLPIHDGLEKRGRLIILRDNEDTFEDITEEVAPERNEKYISFKVDHFSR